jgi:hypothetical protein
MLFDGGSLGAYYYSLVSGSLNREADWIISIFGGLIAAFVFAIAMYITVTIPAIRTVVTPVVGVDTREDQIEAMRVLSAGNTLMMVLLGGVLTLQVSETACRWKLRIRTGGLFFFFFDNIGACRVGKNGLGDWKSERWQELRLRKRKKN